MDRLYYSILYEPTCTTVNFSSTKSHHIERERERTNAPLTQGEIQMENKAYWIWRDFSKYKGRLMTSITQRLLFKFIFIQSVAIVDFIEGIFIPILGIKVKAENMD